MHCIVRQRQVYATSQLALAGCDLTPDLTLSQQAKRASA